MEEKKEPGPNIDTQKESIEMLEKKIEAMKKELAEKESNWKGVEANYQFIIAENTEKLKSLENDGLLIVLPIDKTPGLELKEKIRKTLASCKAAVEDHMKKKTIYTFLELLIASIVTAMVGEVKPEGSKEYKEKIAKIGELENEISLAGNTIKKLAEENSSLKANFETLEKKFKIAEKRGEEFSQKHYKSELMYKDSEARRSTIQTDYTTLLEEAKTLRKQIAEKFQLERSLADLTQKLADEAGKLKEAEEDKIKAGNDLKETKLRLDQVEKELSAAKEEVKESKKVKDMEKILEKERITKTQLEEDCKIKGRKVGELTIELEDLKTKYVTLKNEFDDYQASQELILKKNANDLKEVRRQYNKEKELCETLSQAKGKFEKECKELKEKIETVQRHAAPVKSVTSKEKAIVEALSTRVEMLSEDNEKLRTALEEKNKKIEFYEGESKVKLQLLVNYAAKYTQDHLEEYKSITIEAPDEAYIKEVIKGNEEQKNQVLVNLLKENYKMRVDMTMLSTELNQMRRTTAVTPAK